MSNDCVIAVRVRVSLAKCEQRCFPASLTPIAASSVSIGRRIVVRLSGSIMHKTFAGAEARSNSRLTDIQTLNSTPTQ